MNYIVYKLQVGDYFYFGSGQPKRLSNHLSKLRSKTHPNKNLRDAWGKGEDYDFVILFNCHCREEAYDLEQMYLDLYYGKDGCANRNPDARSAKGLKHSEDTKAKMSASRRGRKKSDDHKAKISRAQNKAVQALLPDGTARTWVSGRAAAQELGVSVGAVSQWCAGKSPQPGSGQRLLKRMEHLRGWVFSYI